MTAAAGPYWSLMFEISESQYKPVEWRAKVQLGGKEWPKIVYETLQGAINTQLMTHSNEVVSIYHRRYGRLTTLHRLQATCRACLRCMCIRQLAAHAMRQRALDNLFHTVDHASESLQIGAWLSHAQLGP